MADGDKLNKIAAPDFGGDCAPEIPTSQGYTATEVASEMRVPALTRCIQSTNSDATEVTIIGLCRTLAYLYKY
jgi:hypothetical protein